MTLCCVGAVCLMHCRAHKSDHHVPACPTHHHRPLQHVLAQLHETPGVSCKGNIEDALRHCLRAVGPQDFLRVVPLNFTFEVRPCSVLHAHILADGARVRSLTITALAIVTLLVCLLVDACVCVDVCVCGCVCGCAVCLLQEDDTYPRAWLLPLLKDNVNNSSVW